MNAAWDLLVVDDDPEILEELTDLLEGEGHRCYATADPRQARAQFLDNPRIGIAIVDLRMPEIDGLSLVRALREEAGAHRILEAILLTGQGGEADVIEALRLGVVDYQKKPVDVDNLLLAIARATERLEAHREIRAREREVAQLQEQVIRDPLTGLFNRRYLYETLERELARAKREGTPLSVVLIDADRFKQLNDGYGHVAGDQVLVALANVLQESSRKADIVCRYGGEEFAVVMVGASADDAYPRVDRWREAFATRRVPFEDQEIKATFSAGIAAYPSHGASPRDLLATADEALYAAKAQGRNRVCIASA